MTAAYLYGVMPPDNQAMPLHTHQTLTTFGYPESLLADFGRWVVLLRPKQPTLGSLVLAAADPAASFAALEPATQAEFGAAVARVDRVLRTTLGCDKINYLMLMMVDPHVHAHVIPRYAASVQFDGRLYPDAAWPKPPILAEALDIPAVTLNRLTQRLQAAFSAL